MKSIEDILGLVRKPSRYIGGEASSVKKDIKKCRLTFALAFPDAYEVGMSHQGIQILYSILNGEREIAAERVYAPWPDMELLMRRENIPLSSLESRMPLNLFDIVGFSLQYELSCTNVLGMLDLGCIPIHSKDRKEGAPIVVAGGPCTFNPVPMSPFIDAFVIGEGEDAVLEISRTVMEKKSEKAKREDILAALAEIEGIYVPALHGNRKKIRKRTVKDLDSHPLPARPVVPLIKTVHDRATLEIARGCGRGCRFCQAGMVWRPVRERSFDTLKNTAKEVIFSTGYDEISLLSLSAGDYSRIEYLLKYLANRYCERKIALALPSLRTETLTEELVKQIEKVRKTSFTLAPEAGTQRLRNVINKGNTEEDLIAAAKRVFNSGWKSVKLYFMIGLPTEMQEDLEGIIDLSYKVLKEGKNRRQVTVSLSTFVPKPHTPFQWNRQIGLDETREKQLFFKDNLRHRNLNLKWHDPRVSLLEGLLSRGDERIGLLIERVYSSGCRFDGWSDQFRFDLWEQALEDLGIETENYTKERKRDEVLPWDFIDCGFSGDFLLREHERSFKGELTEDCRISGCHGCGVCKGDLRIVEATDFSDAEKKTAVASADSSLQDDSSTAKAKIKKLRMRFNKTGTSSFLSHLEVSSAIVRAITRSGLLFLFSEGFHPHPKISFPCATQVGIESLCEYADIQIRDNEEDIEGLAERISSFLPAGIDILDIEEIPIIDKPLSGIIAGFYYEIFPFRKVVGSRYDDCKDRIKKFLETDSFTISRDIKGKHTERNIRPLVGSLSFDEGNCRIDMFLRFNSGGGVRPSEILTQVMGFGEEDALNARIVKTKTIFQKEPICRKE